MRNCYSLRNITNHQLNEKLIDICDSNAELRLKKHFFSECVRVLKVKKSNELFKANCYQKKFSSFTSLPEFNSDEQENGMNPNELPTPLELIAKIQAEIGSRCSPENAQSDSEEKALAEKNRERLQYLHEDSFQSEYSEGDPDMRFTIEKYYALQKELREQQQQNMK